MACVFVSHSSRDGPVVDAIAAFLRDEEHHSVFLDRHPDDGIAVGQLWEGVLYDRLHAADAVVCVVTENHVASRWCFAEVAVAKALGRHILPVGAQAGVRHPLLAPVQGLDYLADPAAARSALGDRLRVIEAGGGAAWDPKRPLFPGLEPFDTSDAPAFFGREAETDRLAALVRSLTTQRAPRAVVVVGASGSGKSSLVRAGLTPRLVADGWWALPPVLPGPDPLRALSFAVAQAWKALQPARQVDLAGLSARVAEDFPGVAEELLLAAPGVRQGLLVIVDQFEEAFTRAGSAVAAQFLAVLDHAAEVGTPIAVVATMRSEFLGELLACEAAGRFRDSQFPVVPLERARLASIIRGPARLGRRSLSEDLVQRLVDDTGSGEALPLLAYVLRLLTEHRPAGDHIDVDSYHRIGGVRGALRIQADATLTRAVTATGRTADEILTAFIGLVSLDGEVRPTRRRVLRSAVAPDLLAAFEMFVDARLLSSADVGGEAQFAVSHEALFTSWPQLSAAITGHAERLQLLRRIEQAAADWDRAGQEPSMLWRGAQLGRAHAALPELAGPSGPGRLFVEAAWAADEAGRRREADILADRIRASGLMERDSELAVLLLLVAADEYAPTAAVVGGLRQALARHRLLGRLPEPDAQMTALAVSDEAIAVADLGTNLPVRMSTMREPTRPAGSCRVNVWSADTLTLVRTLWLDGREVGALDVRGGPAGTRLAIGVDERVVVADVNADAPIDQGASIGSSVEYLSLSYHGDRVFAQPQLGPVITVDVATTPTGTITTAVDPNAPGAMPRRRPRFDGPDDTVVMDDDWPESFRATGWPVPPASSIRAWSVPGRRVVATDEFGIALLAADPVDAPRRICHMDELVHAVRSGPDGSVRAVTRDGRIVDVSSGSTHGPLGAVHAVSADGAYLLAGREPRLCDTVTGSHRPIAVTGGSLRAAAFSEDGRLVAVATWGSLSVFDVATGSLLRRFGLHTDEEGDLYNGVALSRDGTRLVTTSLGGGRAHVWDITSGQPIKPVPQQLVDTSPDGADVIARDFRDIFADLSAGVEFRAAHVVIMVAPDRQALLMVRPGQQSGTGNRAVEEYTLPDGHPLFTDAEPCVAAAFSADARHVLFARPDGTIAISRSRVATDVIGRARQHVFRALTREDRRSFALDG